MFPRFRKAGDWRLKVYLVESVRRGGRVVQETVAYLGSIDTRHLGLAPDDNRERASIRARIQFWEATNPKLRPWSTGSAATTRRSGCAWRSMPASHGRCSRSARDSARLTRYPRRTFGIGFMKARRR